MSKIKRITFYSLIFIWLIPCAFGSQDYLNVSPQVIDLGETVSIKISKSIDISTHKIQVLSPLGKAKFPVPEEKPSHFEIFFSETYERGFLTETWNQYEVNLLDRDSNTIERKYFHIRQNRKQLFFTVYVDDIGGGGYLHEEGEDWFKGLGGRINYGYENDEWAPATLSSVVKRYFGSGDSLFYHFHPLEYTKPKIFLKINRFLRWKKKKELINRLIKTEFRDRHYALFVAIFVALSLGILIYKRNKATYLLGIFAFVLFTVFFFAIYSSQMVLNQRHWTLKYSDTEWCKRFLLEAKREFENNNLPFPHIIRFGFNIPPRGLNKFFLTQMGILADASFIFPKGIKTRLGEKEKPGIGMTIPIDEEEEREILSQLGQYSYSWPSSIGLPLPYYTAISGELNSPFIGDETNRGILEMPLTFKNVWGSDIHEANRGIIDRLPSGALVSTYIHPRDDLRSLKDFIFYLRNNCALSFISASDYLKVYLSYRPRPVLIDSKREKAFWAYLDGNQLIPISESHSFVVKSNELISQTKGSPPYIGLIGDIGLLGEMKDKYALVTINDENVALYKLIR